MLRGKADTRSNPNPEAIAKWTVHKGKIPFLQWSLSGFINHTKEKAPRRAVEGQHHTKALIFFGGFCLTMLWAASFFTLLILCLDSIVSDFIFTVFLCGQMSASSAFLWDLFLCVFCPILACLYFIFIYIQYINILIYIYSCLYSKRERKVVDWGKWGSGGGSWERGNCNLNILYKKSTFNLKGGMSNFFH